MSGIVLKVAVGVAVGAVVLFIEYLSRSRRESEYGPHEGAPRFLSEPPRPPPDCRVCHKPTPSSRITLSCGHMFHRDCLSVVFEETVKDKRHCPVRECHSRIPDSVVRNLGL